MIHYLIHFSNSHDMRERVVNRGTVVNSVNVHGTCLVYSKFLVDADVQNIYPKHGIRQVSVGLFEEEWETREFAELP